MSVYETIKCGACGEKTKWESDALDEKFQELHKGMHEGEVAFEYEPNPFFEK